MTTVSNYLNGRHSQMSAVTRDRVRAVIEQLGYHPNHVARSLATRRTATIGLIVSELTNALYPPVILGAESACRAAQYSLLLANAPDIEAERRAVELMRRKQVDGLILFSVSFIDIANEHLVQTLNTGVPLVVINRAVPEDVPIPRVLLDNFRGAYLATRHLVELGHRRIAHLAGPANRFTGRDRRAGYLAALDEAGLPAEPALVIEGDYSFESGYRAMRAVLDSRPSAVFIGGDAMALGALRAIRDCGLRVPDDVSLVAFGNPDFVHFATPALTTVDLPIVEAGRIAVELLLERLSGRELTGQARLLEPRLLVRESTARLS